MSKLPFSTRLNAICEPSGAHVGSKSCAELLVTFVCIEPDLSVTKISRLPLRRVSKAIRLPSGDRVGPKSGAGEVVRRRSLPSLERT